MRNELTQSTIQNAKDLWADYLLEIEEKLGQNLSQIFEKWPEIIGSRFADLTKPICFQNGILKIEVKSSSLYSLLVQNEKSRLLKRVQKQFPKAKIRKLLFCIG